MEPTFFYIGVYFLVSLLHIASSRVDNYNGWKNSPSVQYHIQTDEGEERYFKYQTKSGQYRKEKRLQDGTVVGTYGWVDPNGYLRLRDYIADNKGYRILKTKMIYVGGNSIGDDSTPGTFHTKYSPLPSVSFQLPLDNQNHRFGGYSPTTPNAYIPPSDSSYLPPYLREPYQNYITTTPTSTGHYSSSSQVNPYVSYPSYYSSTPLVEVSHHSAPKSSTPVYVSSTPSPSVTVFSDPTPKPIAAYSTTPKPIAVNYVTPSSTPSPVISYSTTPSSVEHSTASGIRAIGIASSTTPPPSLPPISGRFAFFDRNNNFVTETEKNKLFFQHESKNDNYYNDRRYLDYKNDFQEYDGISTVQNGFRYYLPRHYHEEETSADGQERTGSFGYIDPFGIRRVIYYNTAPGRGFVHRKNNRYVGFDSTPYDPRPNF